jgi:hypothetical protein
MNMKPNLLPPGSHPGFSQLKEKAGVFRCSLKPVSQKKKPEYADYGGLLPLSGGSAAHVLLWVHADGNLGIRVELIKNNKPTTAPRSKLSPKP